MKKGLIAVLVTVSSLISAQVVSVSPTSSTKCPTDSLFLVANASGGSGVLSYRWYLSSDPTDTLGTNDSLLLINDEPATHGVLSIYVCEVRDDLNSTATSQTFVFVTTPIIFTVGADTVKCPSDTIRVQGQSPESTLTYAWDTDVTNNLMQEDTNSYFNVNKSGLYWVIASPPPASGKCPAIDSIVISDLFEPLNLISTPSESCVGDSVTLSNLSNYPIGSSFNWSTGDMSDVSTVDSSGKYFLTLTAPSPYNCLIIDSISVLQTITPSVNLFSDSTICFGDSLELHNTALELGVLGPYWRLDNNTIGGGDSIWVSTPGLYSLSYTSLNGICEAKDSILLNDLNLGFTLDFDTLYCDTSAIRIFPVGHQMGSHSYIWNGVLASDTLTVNSSGTYSLTISNSLGCQHSDSIRLIFVSPTGYDLLLIDSDTSVFSLDLNDEILNLSQYSYVLSNQDDDTLLEDNPDFVFNEDGVYHLSLTHNLYECMEDYDLDVTLTPDPVFYELFVPSAFSPSNSITRNQSLYLEGTSVSEENFSFKVYNKWGAIVFESNSFAEMNTIGWDGLKSGESVNSGTYTYTLKGSYLNGDSIQMTGAVTYFR